MFYDINIMTLIKQVYQKSVCFVIFWYFKDVGYAFKSHIYNRFHDLLMSAYELKTLQF